MTFFDAPPRLKLAGTFFLCLLLVCLGASVAEAQQVGIRGQVVDGETGLPLAGATVQVVGQGDAQGTDDLGRFAMSVGPGSYSVEVSLIGYHTARIDGINVEAGALTEVTFSLRTNALMLNPIVVSASRRQEKALDAPASISAVSAGEIARTIAATPVEHIRSLPGLDMVQTGLTQHSVVARGFNDVFSGSMLMIMDNRYARIPSLRFNAHNMIPATDLDIERIEVSLGPGAALYGPNAASGVMHIITTSPIDRPGNSVSLAGGERSVFHGQFRSAHRVSDGFGLKVSGQYFRGNDFEHVDPLEVVDRDFLNERYSVDTRFDFRFAGDAELILTGGVNTLASSIEMTGIGAAQAGGWEYRYGQLRFTKNRLFAQAFLNQSDSGDETVLLRTNELVVDRSRAMAFQFQYGFDLGDWQSFTYGVDWQRADPRTEGTITGRNEDDDNISEIGAYLHSETSFGSKLDLVTAIRVDDHNRLSDPNISPRAALVFKPTENQTFRATFNRAFGTPSTNNLFLDIVAGNINLPGGAGYAIRAVGVPPGGFTFADRCEGGFMNYCMRSPFLAGQIPANATVFWDSLVDLLPELDPRLSLLVPALKRPGAIPTDPELGTIIRRLDPTAGAFPLDVVGPSAVDPLSPTIHNTYEIGYKGLIRDRVLLAADIYSARVEDFVGPLAVETPSVFLDPASVHAFVTSRLQAAIQGGLVTPEQVELIIAGLAGVPLGTIVPDGIQSPDMIVTYRNFGDISYWGADFAAEVLVTDRLRLSGTYSFQSKECFDAQEDDDCSSTEDIALNAPSHKGTFGFTFDDQEVGLSFGGRVRVVTDFPMNADVYVGDVEGYRVIDGSLSYRLPFSPGARISVSGSNLLNDLHREFVGAPELGRLLLFRLQYDFGG